ncbi:MAG TPA: response regulator [Terriglobales bacterium]|jgi:CheY-like chemotaxis protein|nr:response regulator [Terriglobales bacterium]
MQNASILLVEDNPDHEALTIRALKKAHVLNDIIVAHDGAEAVELMFGAEGDSGRRPIPAPQLILLDLKLPKVDGLEVLRRLRENPKTKLIPVVVLTSSDEEGDVVTSYKLGANSYVCKPVDFVQFMEATKQLGLYWLVLNEAPKAARAAAGH